MPSVPSARMPDAISLRPLTVEDADAMTAVLAAPSLYEFTGGAPPTPDELARRYRVQTRGHSADGTELWVNFVVTLGPALEPIGYVQATLPVSGDSAEIAWVIGQPWQGRGYAFRAATLLLEDLASRGVRHVTAHIHPRNQGSNQLASRLGLRPTNIVVDGEIRWSGAVASLRTAPSTIGSDVR